MKNQTTVVLIHLLELALDQLKGGNSNISEDEGISIIESMRGILYPQPSLEVYNISQACDKLHISQPTFRKYVKQGKIPKGIKIAGFKELVWCKNDINKLNL